MSLAAPSSQAKAGERTPTLAEAIYLAETQEKLVEKIETHLERMRELAFLNADSRSPVREDLSQEFQHHLGTIWQMAALELNGFPLFDGCSLAVELERENKLVLAGANLQRGAFRVVFSTNISDKESALHAHETIEGGMLHLQFACTVVAANLSRLAFLHRQQGSLRSFRGGLE